MDKLKAFTPLLTAFIAFVAVLTALGLLFELQLKPVKKDIANMKTDISKLESGLSELNQKFDKLLLNFEIDKKVTSGLK